MERSFRENLQNNNRISELRKALEAGTATYSEADMYAVEVGQALAKAFHDNVSSSGLPDGKMYYNIASRVIPPPLRTSYEDIAEYAKAMQRGMNERARLGIKAQSAAYNEDREKGLIERACGADQYDDIRKSFEEDLVNFDQAVVTDTLHANAEFQYQAGLSPVIRRTANGGCCGWCAKLAGTYPYEDVRDTGNDVYRRHRACRCKVAFDPGDGKVQDVHTKRWTQRMSDDKIQSTGGKKTGTDRAKAYSKGWPTGSLKDARKKFANEGVTVTEYESGKIRYISKDGRYEVIEDIYGGYFRVLDHSIPGKRYRRKYVDLDGNDMRNVTEDTGRTRGRNREEYERATHFRNTD